MTASRKRFDAVNNSKEIHQITQKETIKSENSINLIQLNVQLASMK